MSDSGKKLFIASYRIGDFPHAGLKLLPWSVAPCDGVLINAYDFLMNGRTARYAKKLLASPNPLASLMLPSELILDSGAYYFMRSDAADINPIQVVELAVRLGVPYVVTLDHPFPPGLSAQEVLRRIRTTAYNTAKMSKSILERAMPRPSLMPAIHGHDADTLIESMKSQPVILRSDTKRVGVGSLAMLAQKGAMREAAEAMINARRILLGKHMHVFSMGSPLAMHFAFICGADSVDSQSWMMSAAFKQVHLPGMAQLRLSTRERERNIKMYDARRKRFEDELLRLQNEELFQVKDWESGKCVSLRDRKDASAYTDLLEDGPCRNRVHWRACHNLGVATFEARRITQEIEKGTIADFLLARHKNGPYSKALNYVLDRVHKSGLLNKKY